MARNACTMPTRPKPCAECPWSKETAPGQFPAHRYSELAATTGCAGAEAPLGSPMFACHKSAEGKELPCAGWLAAVGVESLTVRVLVATGQLPADALTPGDDWPELFSSYSEMASAMTEGDPSPERDQLLESLRSRRHDPSRFDLLDLIGND